MFVVACRPCGLYDLGFSPFLFAPGGGAEGLNACLVMVLVSGRGSLTRCKPRIEQTTSVYSPAEVLGSVLLCLTNVASNASSKGYANLHFYQLTQPLSAT